jgi:hypothetical protein
MPRFILLDHTGAPDDPHGRHVDLLLEADGRCRTWRLEAMPQPGGPPVEATELPAHRLQWLDHVEGPVSGGRGFARRLDAGDYALADPSTVTGGSDRVLRVVLRGAETTRRLTVMETGGLWRVWSA